MHYIFLIGFVAVAGVILALTVFFKIDKIEVTGNIRYNHNDIIEASGITAGENMLRLRVGEIEENLLQEFPYIESVRIRRRIPTAIEISVIQSIPAYAIRLEDGLSFITADGKLLETGSLLVPPELPVVKGLNVVGFSPGDDIALDPENSERLVMLRYLAAAAEKTSFGPITNVDLTNHLNMTTVYEARLVLVLGSESDLEYKLTFLKEIIADLHPDDHARLDASNAKDKRVLAKWGRVENGEFFATTAAGHDHIFLDDAGS